MADDFKRYPKGVISHKVGDLQQCTTFKVSSKNGAKLKHTLRRTPSGYVLGVQEVTLSFELEIHEDGPERDFYSSHKSGAKESFRLKFPGETYKFTGVSTTHDMDSPLDDAVKKSLEYVGRLEPA